MLYHSSGDGRTLKPDAVGSIPLPFCHLSRLILQRPAAKMGVTASFARLGESRRNFIMRSSAAILLVLGIPRLIFAVSTEPSPPSATAPLKIETIDEKPAQQANLPPGALLQIGAVNWPRMLEGQFSFSPDGKFLAAGTAGRFAPSGTWRPARLHTASVRSTRSTCRRGRSARSSFRRTARRWPSPWE